MERRHFLLFTEATVDETVRLGGGRWRFALESLEGSDRIEADDVDDDRRLDRLNLLAVVRGLEALEAPSRVTLLTMSWYVRRGFSEGLEIWRQHDWKWETFGQWTSVTNEDLWRRVDRALQFHNVHCRTWRLDAGDTPGKASISSSIATPDVADPAENRPDPYRAAVRPPRFLKRRAGETARVDAPHPAAAEPHISVGRTYRQRISAAVKPAPGPSAPTPPGRRKRA